MSRSRPQSSSSRLRQRAQQRAALNRPRLPFEGKATIALRREDSPPTLTYEPPRPTAIERTARGARYHVMLWQRKPGVGIEAVFVCGTSDEQRACILAAAIASRAVVVEGVRVKYDNHQPIPEVV